jgi:hypothetical protein
MKQSDLVILCSTKNKNIEEFQIQMLDSFVQTTPEECKLLIIENNSNENCYKTWKNYVLSKKQNFIFSQTDFNLSKLYNEGYKITKNEYIMYANSDLIFHENWYYNLLNWFDIINNLYVISPFTKIYNSDWSLSGAYRKDLTLKNEFFETPCIPGWFYCFKRKNSYTWDEKIKAHFQDNDFINHLVRLQKADPSIKSGIAYNSRVDHLIGMTYKNFQQDYFFNEGKEIMKQKWGENFI